MTRPLTCSNSSKSRDKGRKKHGLDVHREGLSEPDATMARGCEAITTCGLVEHIVLSRHYRRAASPNGFPNCTSLYFDVLMLVLCCELIFEVATCLASTKLRARTHGRARIHQKKRYRNIEMTLIRNHPTATQCVWAGISSVALVAVVDNDTPILVDCNVPE
jgi:hypothetical protein